MSPSLYLILLYCTFWWRHRVPKAVTIISVVLTAWKYVSPRIRYKLAAVLLGGRRRIVLKSLLSVTYAINTHATIKFRFGNTWCLDPIYVINIQNIIFQSCVLLVKYRDNWKQLNWINNLSTSVQIRVIIILLSENYNSNRDNDKSYAKYIDFYIIMCRTRYRIKTLNTPLSNYLKCNIYLFNNISIS